MTTTIIDTTVLTDALLKTGSAADAARSALAEALVPHYAIKEFRCGPFMNFVYAHNVLVEAGTVSGARERIRRLPPIRQYLKRTAEEALAEAESDFYRRKPAGMQRRWRELAAESGRDVTGDSLMAGQFRRFLRRRIDRAWAQSCEHERHAIGRLACFQNDRVKDHPDGTLTPRSHKCVADCVLSVRDGGVFEGRDAEIRVLIGVVEAQEAKEENRKRVSALRVLVDQPQEVLSNDACRGLGDAVFALLCPPGGTILTTNLKDHEPLALALGKTARRPT